MERTHIQPAVHESVRFTFERHQVALWRTLSQLGVKLSADAADLLHSVSKATELRFSLLHLTCTDRQARQSAQGSEEQAQPFDPCCHFDSVSNLFVQPEQVVFPHVRRLISDGALRPLQRPAQLTAHVLEPLQQLGQDMALLQPGRDPGCVLRTANVIQYCPVRKVWSSLLPLSHSLSRLLPGFLQLSCLF